MSKTIYSLMIFLLAFTVATGLFHGILYRQLGPQLIWLDAFLPWFSAVTVLTVATSILLLKYFYSRKFMTIFYAGIVAILFHLLYIFAFYKVLISARPFTYSL